MSIRIVQNCKWLAWLGYGGMTIYPFIFLSGTFAEAWRTRVLQHECIHVYQVRRDGWAWFYCEYLLDYLVNLAKYQNHQAAYHNIPYEAEAYAKQWSVGTRELFQIIGRQHGSK